jgi:uncharacterized membrane protein
MKTLFLGGTIAFTILATAAILLIPVTVSKPGLLFGVTVAPDAAGSRVGRAILAGWRILIVASALVLAAASLIASAILTDTGAFVVSLASMFIFLFVILVGMVAFHQRALALELPGSGSVRAAPARARSTQSAPWWWEILPLAIIAATAIVLAVQYPSAPARIPIHFNYDGQPDTFVQKSIGAFYGLVWTQIGLWLLLTVIGIFIGRVQTPNGGGRPTFVAVAIRFLYWVKTGLLVLLGGMQILLDSGYAHAWVWIALTILTLIAIFVGVAILVRHYSSIVQQRPVPGDATADQYWIGGIIYRNPADPALFVERRLGVGYTLNLGNPMAWIVLVGLIVLAVGIPIVTRAFVR